MREASTAEGDAYLRGVEFPASKLEVPTIAEANGAPQATLESLQRVNCERFETLEAVEAAQFRAEPAGV